MAGKRRAGRDPVRAVGRDPSLLPPSLSPPAAPEVVIRPELGRREERRQRKRQQRRKLGLAGGIGIAVLAIGGIATLIVGVQQVVTNSGGGKRTQLTLLLQVQASDHTSAGTVLLAADPSSKQGLEVLIPNRLITDVCGYGSQNFGTILSLPNGATASRNALSTLLGGVTIDGSWVISETDLSNLVNEVGGIDVDVNTTVVQRTPGGGGRVLVAPGQQHLNGTQAVEYATYSPGQEGAAGVLARLQGVVDATIQALPRTLTGVQALVRQMPRTSQSTIGSQRLAQLLFDLRRYDQREAGVFPTDLPVTVIDSGGPTPSYRVDNSPSTGIKALVSNRLSDSLPSSANSQHASVYLLNGLGVPGLVGTACPRLAANGFTYAGSGNAPTFSNARSQIEIFRNSDADQGRTLAQALGLPASDVRLSSFNQSVARYVVILGSDYKP